jgi:hypothetical protein
MPTELDPSSPLSDAETRALSHAKPFWRPVYATPTVWALAARALVEVIPLTGSVLSIWQWRITPAGKAVRGGAAAPKPAEPWVRPDLPTSAECPAGPVSAEAMRELHTQHPIEPSIKHHPKGTLERKIAVGICGPVRHPPAPSQRRVDPAAAARAIEHALEDDSRTRFGGLGRREYGPTPTDSKQALRDMLAQAAANTAKMQEKQR